MCITLIRSVRRTIVICSIPKAMALRQSSDMAKFKEALKSAKRVVILSGAGISAESGIPTFRGEGGLWRKYKVETLATPEAFMKSPSLVWEFYHYRREVASKAHPNAAHLAIAHYEARHGSDKTVTVITQNVDGLHTRAGTKNLIELHGSLFKTRCTKCKDVTLNFENPICEGLSDRGCPDPAIDSEIPNKFLPHCRKSFCRALLRPHVVWFGENLDPALLEKSEAAMATCDVCLVVGTSSKVYPVAMFAPQAASRGAIVAEFNIEPTPKTKEFNFYFEGLCGTTLPVALAD